MSERYGRDGEDNIYRGQIPLSPAQVIGDLNALRKLVDDRSMQMDKLEKARKDNVRLQRERDELKREKLNKWTTTCKEAIQHLAHVRELEATVDALPKCWQLKGDKTELVQDCPVVPGMTVYWMYPTARSGGTECCSTSGRVRYVETMAPEDSRNMFVYPIEVETDNGKPYLRDCYNSLEAAEFAKKKGTT